MTSVDVSPRRRSDEPAPRQLVIDSAVSAAEDVLVLTLADRSGSDLPAWAPGAHIDVAIPSLPVRQYSLCGDPADRESYRIAVLRGVDPRGLSHRLHAAAAGQSLQIAGPRNRFRLQDAPGYLFVAGGIGITPILPMIRDVSTRGVPWRLTYGARTYDRMAFADEIRTLPGGQVDYVAEDDDGPLDMPALVRRCPDDIAIYACGPPGMVHAVEKACRRWRPDQPPAVERFSAAPLLAAPLSAATGAGAKGRRAFDVELRRTGVTLTVPANRTLLSVVREALPKMPFSCEEGVCGTCETGVLDGVPEHHDEVLTEAERAEGVTMMICVGRSATPLLVLDL